MIGKTPPLKRGGKTYYQRRTRKMDWSTPGRGIENVRKRVLANVPPQMKEDIWIAESVINRPRQILRVSDFLLTVRDRLLAITTAELDSMGLAGARTKPYFKGKGKQKMLEICFPFMTHPLLTGVKTGELSPIPVTLRSIEMITEPLAPFRAAEQATLAEALKPPRVPKFDVRPETERAIPLPPVWQPSDPGKFSTFERFDQGYRYLVSGLVLPGSSGLSLKSFDGHQTTLPDGTTLTMEGLLAEFAVDFYANWSIGRKISRAGRKLSQEKLFEYFQVLVARRAESRHEARADIVKIRSSSTVINTSMIKTNCRLAKRFGLEILEDLWVLRLDTLKGFTRE